MFFSFGVKQAREANKFAKTKDERRVVLATMAMLGIKNKIKDTAKKSKVKILGKMASNDTEIVKLSKKIEKCDGIAKTGVSKLGDVISIDLGWTF